jgi:hypothetical protein
VPDLISRCVFFAASGHTVHSYATVKHDTGIHIMDEPETDKIKADSRAFHGEVEFTSPENPEFSLKKNIRSIDQLTEARRTDLPAVESLWAEVKTHVEENADEISRRLAENLIQALRAEYERQAEAACESGQWDRFESSLLFSSLEDLQEAVEDGPNGNPLPDRTPEEWKEDPPERILELAENYTGGDASSDEVAEQWAGQAASAVTYEVSRTVDRWFQTKGVDPDEVSDSTWQKWLRGYLERGPELPALVNQIMEHGAVQIVETLRWSREEQGFTPSRIERFLGLVDEETAPTPRIDTSDYDPDPFTGPNKTAALLANTFSNAVKNSLMEADGEPAETKVGKWGRGPSGTPVRVEKLKNPYEGRAVLKVQAHSNANPAEVEAAMGWKMLERMDMDTVWLHSVLLAHACAPHRRGNREVMTIPRKRVENALGIRQNRNMTVRERAERVKKHVEALQSLYVQFQGVRRHGEKLHFEGDMTASPLWFVQMKARGQKDLFTGEVTADWHLKVKEGVWGSEFLHNHGDQWTPFPKEWFDQIDRRGKDWTQRLAVALLFLFRINSKRGGEVKLSAEKMLDICGTDMSGSSRRGTERKRRLSKSLDALSRNYNIDVRAEDVHIDNTSQIEHSEWKQRVATFYPPKEISGELFRNEDDGAPPLPDVKGGDWTAAQIKQLRSNLGDTQSEFAGRLNVSRQMVSRYENRHDPPSDRVRKILDRLDSRFR